MISVSNLIVGLIAILILSGGFTYHLGWKHGWVAGFSSGNRVDADSGERQPRVKHIWGFIYALGWHKGWDYGFREGMRRDPEQSRSKNT